ncbi:hypothetical protein [Deferrisoma camini]|uniref:hypothetical protein n=1 Tax=Deferrisoma camini TaxID=1035120 RepID=UPI00146ED1C9|nr:hypothetical protein [Deferrisoma camini]
MAPVPTRNATAFVTEHFRLLWGNEYDRSDPDWADADGNGRPDWVDETATALETAYDEMIALGFPSPYGADTYFLDVYFVDTGLEVCSRENYDPDSTPSDKVCMTELGPGAWVEVSFGKDDSSYYAYTEIDNDYGVAYFVFNDDFSLHADDERSVLRATAAHELFHAVQRSLGYPWDDEVAVPDSRWRDEGWWFEATATWMEEVVTPEVDDYVTYVREFLAHPEDPLNSQDGLHEYGAAIFPGFLWLRYDGPDFWIEVFSRAYDEGLEVVLDDALLARAGVPLGDAIATFWTLAAHPEDFWPDGERFRAPAVPSLARTASTLPLTYASSSSSAPGRYGANLFRAESAPSGLEVSFSSPNPVTARLAFSRGGGAFRQVVEVSEGDTRVDIPGSGPLYVAVMNEDSSDLEYSLGIVPQTSSSASQPSSDTTPEAASAGASGGCFLTVLSHP